MVGVLACKGILVLYLYPERSRDQICYSGPEYEIRPSSGRFPSNVCAFFIGPT